jgi:hypothetical protein
MRYFLMIGFIITASFLQSCDERITPKQLNVQIEPEPTKLELLTAHSWQYSEAVLRGGGKTIVQFSRANSITLSSEISTQKDTYRNDGTFTTESNVKNRKGTWKFSSDEKQVTLTDDRGVIRTFDITRLDGDHFDFTETTTKASIGNDTLWTELLTRSGLPATATEFVTSYLMIPI